MEIRQRLCEARPMIQTMTTRKVKKLPDQIVLVASVDAPWAAWRLFGLGHLAHKLGVVASGISGFFSLNLQALYGVTAPVGITDASFYSTDPLRGTLQKLVNFDLITQGATRLTLRAAEHS